MLFNGFSAGRREAIPTALSICNLGRQPMSDFKFGVIAGLQLALLAVIAGLLVRLYLR